MVIQNDEAIKSLIVSQHMSYKETQKARIKPNIIQMMLWT